jgi:hypothetical protein
MKGSWDIEQGCAVPIQQAGFAGKKPRLSKKSGFAQPLGVK